MIDPVPSQHPYFTLDTAVGLAPGTGLSFVKDVTTLHHVHSYHSEGDAGLMLLYRLRRYISLTSGAAMQV